jgi:hypothetical protein
MNLKELLQHLEERLGYHQFPLNPGATGIKEIFEGSPVHQELVQGLVRAISRQNGCRRLTDPVNRAPTNEALGSVRQELRRRATADVDAHRLIDELCLALNEIFRDETGDASTGKPASEPRPARVIPLDPFRRQRRSGLRLKQK